MDIQDDIGGGYDAFLNAGERDSIGPNGKPSYTIAHAGDQIIRGEPGWSGALGQPFTVTYGFRADAPATMPDNVTGFIQFNPTQIAQAELALNAWSDVANIHFVRVGAGASGDQAFTDNAAILFSN